MKLFGIKTWKYKLMYKCEVILPPSQFFFTPKYTLCWVTDYQLLIGSIYLHAIYSRNTVDLQ